MLHIKDIEAFARINEALAQVSDTATGAGPHDGESDGEYQARRAAMAQLFMQLAGSALTKAPLHQLPPETEGEGADAAPGTEGDTAKPADGA